MNKKLLLLSVSQSDLSSGYTVENILEKFTLSHGNQTKNTFWFDMTDDVFFSWNNMEVQGLFKDGKFFFSYELSFDEQDFLTSYKPSEIYSDVYEFAVSFFNYNVNNYRIGYYENPIGKLNYFNILKIYSIGRDMKDKNFLESGFFSLNIHSTFDLKNGWIDRKNRKNIEKWYNELNDTGFLYLVDYN